MTQENINTLKKSAVSTTKYNMDSSGSELRILHREAATKMLEIRHATYSLLKKANRNRYKQERKDHICVNGHVHSLGTQNSCREIHIAYNY